MAVKFCAECGGNVSSLAAACPHCGAPVGERMVAPPPAPVAGGPQRPVIGILSAVGGFMMLVGFFLPWIGDLTSSQTGRGVPLAFLWDRLAPESWLSAGIVAALLGIVVVSTAFRRTTWVARQVAAGLGVLLVVGIAIQLARLTMDAGVGLLDSVNGLAPGAYLVLGGALLALLSPLASPVPPSQRARPEPEPDDDDVIELEVEPDAATEEGVEETTEDAAPAEAN